MKKNYNLKHYKMLVDAFPYYKVELTEVHDCYTILTCVGETIYGATVSFDFITAWTDFDSFVKQLKKNIEDAITRKLFSKDLVYNIKTNPLVREDVAVVILHPNTYGKIKREFCESDGRDQTELNKIIEFIKFEIPRG